MGLDRRVIKSEEAIKEAFLLTLAEKQDINKVTISRVSQNANVNRATFYRHFKSISALRELVFSEYIGHIRMDKIPAVPAMDDEAGRRKFATEIEKIVTYVASHKRAYSYLVRSNDGRSLIYDYAHDCIDVRMQIDNLPGDDKRYISEMTYRIHGIIGIWQDWASGMLDITEQDLFRKLCQMPEIAFK
ncbi:TetR/AcrR family transcriptional regulator [Secundilactobacillus collinoides]|uniref:TetR/AcrR family transcriptional regulator n=1 Tax=Secundilactobacillus collinoides TaxID=33960 RepID=UPI0007AED3CA|nr:TetR/AcrR family transcriptional regulator [Secundilactobacillus collinoides]